jgi:hypothetical protein
MLMALLLLGWQYMRSTCWHRGQELNRGGGEVMPYYKGAHIQSTLGTNLIKLLIEQQGWANYAVEILEFAANLANKSAVLSVGDISLSSGDLGASASVSALISGLTSDANYADAPFTITDDGSNTLVVTWNDSGVVSSTAELQLTASEQTVSSTRSTTGLSEDDLPAVAEQQFITLSDSNLATATSVVITDSSE